MKEKIKKIGKWILDNWRIFTEIAVIIWAIKGMYEIATFASSNHLIYKTFYENKERGEAILEMMIKANINFPFVWVLFYFLSAILILYLLRKKDKPKPTL